MTLLSNNMKGNLAICTNLDGQFSFIECSVKYSAVMASLTASPAGWSRVMGSTSSGGRSYSFGTRSFLIVAMLWRTTQAPTIWDARSGDTLRSRRQLNRAFKMARVVSILSLVWLRAMLKSCCGFVSGSR